jgi:hypothetical protein
MVNGVNIAPSISRVFLVADLPFIEHGIPPHLLFVACEALQAKGWRMRRDVLRHLNTAASAALAGQDQITVRRCAKAIEQTVNEMLHGASPDDPRDAVLVCAFWLLKLVEAGLFQDTGNTAVLAAIHIMEDAKEDDNWRMNEAWLGETAKAMLRTANLHGLYVKTLALVTVN